MPITNVNSSSDKGPGGGGRTTFRPPWVKGEGPQPVPMPTTPWSKRNSITTEENGQTSQKDAKLQSREVKVPVLTTTKKSPAQPIKPKDGKNDEAAEKKSAGAAEKSGKFERPILKKVAKVEEASKPPSKVIPAADKKNVKETVGKSKVPVEEESSEEEESSYEEVTETETETDSDDPPVPSKKAPSAPVKEVPNKQVAAPTKPASSSVAKPPLTRQISAKNAPVEKPVIPASHAKFTPPKSPFSKKVVTKPTVVQPSPPPELTETLPQSPKTPNEIPDPKLATLAKPVAVTDNKAPSKPPLVKQNSVKPIPESPKQIQNHTAATEQSEPATPKKPSTETPKLTTEPTKPKTEINRPINKKFGLNTGKSIETKSVPETQSVPEKTTIEKVIPSKQVTLKPIPEKTASSKTASEKTTIIKPELKPIPPKAEVIPEPKSLPKPALKPIPPKSETIKSAAPPPPPPPPPSSGAPPPPPPPPGLAPPPEFERKPITEKHKQTLEKLKTRPRKRPDWSDMMKEVESGRKLKHVKCNDRSSPIISCKSVTNIQGQYIFETEKANVHNVLLKQIQSGVHLKPTKTNDRSRPVLEGLRKFRRQMTIEEQIQKSESRAQLNVEVPVEESEDEMDDIDKLRDDLQSTKQMLALELRNKEAQERENKRLLARVQILEAELEREKWQPIAKPSDDKDKTPAPANEALVQSLKKDAEEAQKTSKLLEKKYQDAADQLDAVKNEVEKQRQTIANLERKLAQQSGGVVDTRRHSEPGQKDSSPEPELELSEEDEDEDEEKKAERAARRLLREVKMMSTKLNRLKDKEKTAKRERENLRDAMKKNQGLLKIEHKKFKKLQREVDKMAAMMKDDDEGDGSDDDKPPADEPEESEEESEEEEEESDSDDESEAETDNESESEAEDASDESKKANYEPRIKRHDGRVSALKKGNYLLQANVDRLQDEINKMREKSQTLQRDLDSVLSELG